MAVTKEFAAEGLKAVPFEIDLFKGTDTMDVLSPAGYALAVRLALRTKPSILKSVPASMSLMATVCSTWVWVNRGTSKRSGWNPLGDQSLKQVAGANKMVSRMCLICRLLNARNVWWVLEQPQSSLMEKHPRFQELVADSDVYEARFSMQIHGAETRKPTVAYSNRPEVIELTKGKSSAMRKLTKADLQIIVKSVRYDGKVQIKGGKDLKATQAYPRGFGQKLVRMHKNNCRALDVDIDFPAAKFAKTEVSQRSLDTVLHKELSGHAAWKDADLAPVECWL